MWLRVLAGLALGAVLWRLFRFAMSLRFAKLSREEARQAEESRGRRIVAEIAREDGVVFFVEEAGAFSWGADSVRKDHLIGARLLLNGGLMGAASREGATLPPPPTPREPEAREQWDVWLYLADGGIEVVRCGTLREGVSREIAGHVFEAARAALGGPHQPLRL